MTESPDTVSRGIRAARCHEIQLSLGRTEVPEFELLTEIGMAVGMALHIQGLPAVRYETLKLVANHFLDIPTLVVERIVRLLGEIEFVRITSEGTTIKTVLPNVPYYDDLYDTIGEFSASTRGFNEVEALSLEIVNRLASSPENLDRLRSDVGAEAAAFSRTIDVGTKGSFLIKTRSRGRDILVNPTYFSENAAHVADLVAGRGSSDVAVVMDLVRETQGVPLSVIVRSREIGGTRISDDQLAILKSLAEHGALKPPSVKTSYSGQNHFIFTPAPAGGSLDPTRRDQYERAMAIVAAVRQGQYLPRAYRIRSPAAVIGALRSRGQLSRATTEAREQYQQLVHLRIGQLIETSPGYAEFHIIPTQANNEALNLAYSLVTGGGAAELNVDNEARQALQQPQEYIESLIASRELRTRGTVELSGAQQLELDSILQGGRD